MSVIEGRHRDRSDPFGDDDHARVDDAEPEVLVLLDELGGALPISSAQIGGLELAGSGAQEGRLGASAETPLDEP